MTPELNEPQNNLDVTADLEQSRPSPGALIRRARERARLTPEELSAQIKLSRATLEALERDDFKVLVEPVYVRGYYRKCAKLLDISEKDLVDAYEGRVVPRAPMSPSKLRLASGTELGSGSRLPVALALLAAVVAVVVCAFIWFARGETNRVPPAVAAKVEAMTPEESAPAAASSQSQGAAPQSGTAQAGASGDAGAMLDGAGSVPAAVPTAAPVASSAAVAPSSAPAPATAAAQPAAMAANGTLELKVNVTSWARVDDAKGKTLFNGLVRGGESQQLQGALPFAVFLGNAPGVSLAFDGRPVDLKPYTADNNTARLSLPQKP